MGDARGVVAGGGLVRGRLHPVGRVAHRDRAAGALEHREVVGLVADRDRVGEVRADRARQGGDAVALVGGLGGDVEVIGLRLDDRGVGPERGQRLVAQARQHLGLVADEGDLVGAVQQVVEPVADHRLLVGRAPLAFGVLALAAGRVPPVVGEHPDVDGRRLSHRRHPARGR